MCIMAINKKKQQQTKKQTKIPKSKFTWLRLQNLLKVSIMRFWKDPQTDKETIACEIKL